MTMDMGLAKDGKQGRLARLAEFRFQLRRFLSFSETVSEQMGVAAQQYQLMQVIGAMPEGGAASITYLAERMVLRHNSMVELVDRAARAGMVQRTSDERDLRKSVVVLTEAGRAVLERLIAAHLQELDGESGEQMMRSLGQLRETGTEHEAQPAEGTA